MLTRLTLDALSVTLPMVTEPHPNKAPFRGILTQVDQPSTRPPHGAEGHRVLIPRAVAEAALPSLHGMPIDCAIALKEHEKTNIVGIIEQGHIEGNDLVVEGYLLEKNQPDDVAEIRRQQARLGMSYEVAEVGVEDMHAPIWTLNHLIFTGAAILLKDKAAYQHTAIKAQAEEATLMAEFGDIVLKELRTLRRGVSDLAAARQDDEDEAAARKDEDAATAAEAEAEQAREDNDEEEAARHEASAATFRANAMKRRDEAAKRHREEAAKRTEADDEEGAAAHIEAATHHETEAKRLRDAEAARAVEAAQRTAEAKAGGGVSAAMQQMLEAIGYVPKRSLSAMENDDDDMMHKLFGMFLRAMVYPAGPMRGKGRRAEAAHDDEPEDRALFRRLIKQYRDKDSLDASGRDDLLTRRMDRRLAKLEAAMELITDTLKQQTGLLTDVVHKARNLATDAHRPGQGGPLRRTMQATGTERWVSQLEGGGSEDPDKGKKFTLKEIDAALEDQGLSIREQMAKKLELSWNGKLKDE